ncbi:hypothetical protein K440DRAFT_646056 [Wilcoxina mikolae CBS 423.85]|nr:hypothetical protein K440DRAFT_646056 [Wilcoxina mikolae CBS 423.85]
MGMKYHPSAVVEVALGHRLLPVFGMDDEIQGDTGNVQTGSKSTSSSNQSVSEVSTSASTIPRPYVDVVEEDDPSTEAGDIYEETDVDKSNNTRRRQKYKFQSIIVTVLKVSTEGKCDTIIDKMEVWPTKPQHP